MRHNLNLNPHIILPQPRHPHTSPQRLVVGHIRPEIPHHRVQCLVVDGDMVRIHPEYLLPAFAAGGFQSEFDVFEGLVDLRVDFAVESAGLGVPAALVVSLVGLT